jgi:hypothetical protein
MQPLDISQFKIYSYGIVADNKALSSKIINVTPIEIASMLDGELASNPTTVESKGKDIHEKEYNISVTKDNVIEATWLPFGTNRVTAPDVRRGEPVLIWQYGSTDKYYWSILGLKDDLRRLETVVYAFNANPSEASKEFNPDDNYFIEISTHNKQVTFHTSKANGEPFVYAFQFNTGEGKVLLADDAGNSFEIDSNVPHMKMTLNTGTKVHLDNQKILAEAITELKIKVGVTEMTFTPSITILKTPVFKGQRA